MYHCSHCQTIFGISHTRMEAKKEYNTKSTTKMYNKEYDQEDS